ncbi:MAG TPA: hypothetical protein DCM50_13380 [Stenotrophomonas sp.]|nr:hypothetical protein [Stenotrophomonas sp.]
MGLFSKTKKSKPAGMLGIEAGPQGIALAQVVRVPSARPLLPYCEHLEGSADAQAALLEQTVSERALQGLPANVLLHPSEYQMFLLEAPEVPPQELRDAMRWRIKDMISQSLDDVVIDCFAAGPNSTTLPMKVFASVRMGIKPEINALATLMVLAVSIAAVVGWFITARGEKRRQRDMQMALQDKG